MQGFSTRICNVITSDFRIFALMEAVDYVSAAGIRYRMPKAAMSDLASIPRGLWNLLPPPGENGAEYGIAAYLHDCAYRNTLQIVNADGTVSIANLSKADCDLLLKEAMLYCGVPEAIVETIYEAVNLAGGSSYKEDRS
jgi:hypothetical protein